MAKQQPSREELARIQAAQNQQFMSLSYSQPIRGNAQNGTSYGQGKTLVSYAPIVQGGWAHAITLRYRLQIKTDGKTGSVTPNAGYPENLVRELRVDFGNKVVQATPIIARILDKMEGYARTLQSAAFGFKSPVIENMLNKVPTSFTLGQTYELNFDVTLDLNQLHPASVNGLLPIFGNGTYLQTTLTLPSSLVGADPIDNVFSVTGDAQVTVTGDIEVYYHYRNHISMSTTQAIQPSIDGLPSVQIIQLPTVSPLTAGTWVNQNFRNPYAVAKVINLVVDGKQSNKFSSAENIVGYALDQAENPNSAFIEYGEQTGGMEMYYKEIRSRFGQDLDEGVIIFDATTQNIANVSSKQGTAYLNLTGAGYPAGRQRYKVASVNTTNITPRVVSFAVILNDDPVKAR